MESKEHLVNNGIGSLLLYHVNLIDLITFCTWGKIPAAELMALEVVPFKQMLKSIIDLDHHMQWKNDDLVPPTRQDMDSLQRH